jgi:hypothetical protein
MQRDEPLRGSSTLEVQRRGGFDKNTKAAEKLSLRPLSLSNPQCLCASSVAGAGGGAPPHEKKKKGK